MENIFENGKELEEEDRLRYLNINKMLTYLFSWLLCHIDDEISKDVNDKYTSKVCLIKIIILIYFLIFLY